VAHLGFKCANSNFNARSARKKFCMLKFVNTTGNFTLLINQHQNKYDVKPKFSVKVDKYIKA
jgi:hypothetical protein